MSFKQEWSNIGDQYDVVSFTVNTGQTDYDVKANQVNLFKNVKFATMMVMTFDQNISVKFNNVNNPSVSLVSTQSPMELIKKLNISNIFITNASGSTMNCLLWLFQ